MKVTLQRVNDAVHFVGSGNTADVNVHIDGSPEIGGEGAGVRPMELVLMALGSCSALDLVNILKKQRQQIDGLQIDVEGKRRDEVPNIFTAIHLTFKLQGTIDQAKAEKAAHLAVKKYCSVHDMLAAGGVDITYDIRLND